MSAASENVTLIEGAEIAPRRSVVRHIETGDLYATYLVWDDHRFSLAIAKVLRPEVLADESAHRALRREADALARLAHPVLVLLLGPLAVPRVAEARRHHPKHQTAPVVIARKSDAGGGDEHAGGESHADNQQGDNGDNHNGIAPATHHSANKVGTANTNNQTQHAQPVTHNSVNKVGTANTNNQTQNQGQNAS